MECVEMQGFKKLTAILTDEKRRMNGPTDYTCETVGTSDLLENTTHANKRGWDDLS
jgi:hypothetical protein